MVCSICCFRRPTCQRPRGGAVHTRQGLGSEKLKKTERSVVVFFVGAQRRHGNIDEIN